MVSILIEVRIKHMSLYVYFRENVVTQWEGIGGRWVSILLLWAKWRSIKRNKCLTEIYYKKTHNLSNMNNVMITSSICKDNLIRWVF